MAFVCQPVVAQLSLHIDKHFFEGKEIYKVETTWDNYVWVLGANNFIARISPDNQVEDLTAFFSGYSTKPFTDISSRSADTLLLGTDGDYAFLLTGAQVRHYGAEAGLHESTITSVAIHKQYHIQYRHDSPQWHERPLTITAPNYSYGVDNDLVLAPSDNDFYANRMLIRQNDRKLLTYTHFYGETGMGGACIGTEVSNINLYVHHDGGSTLREVPIDLHASSADAIRAIYVSTRTHDLPFTDDFSIFWAGNTGLNYLLNTRNCFARSTAITFFGDKRVNAINELHLLGALAEDYLSYMLIGTDQGLFVSNESQKQRFSTQYHHSVLGGREVYDMETISDGVPIEVYNMHAYASFPICEQYMYVATNDGLFKMTYSIGAASYEHVGSTLYFNGGHLSEQTIQVCGSGDDVLTLGFYEDVDNFIQWQRNGQDIIGADTNFVYLTEPGVYRAVMWFGCENIEIYSQEVTVSIDDVPKFTFDYPDTVDICEGDTFPLEVTDTQPGYRYQWFRDGAPIDGETLPSYTVTKEGMYHVGVNACGDHFVFSDSITVRLHRLEKPITSDRGILICEGEPRTIRVTGYPPETIKRWYRDDVLLTGESDTALVVTQPGAYSVELALGPCSVMSDPLIVRFVALPVTQIKAATEEPLCDGTSTTLTAVHAANETYTYRWSTGETTRSIQVNTAGVYTLVLTNAAGCADTAAFELLVYDPVPVPHIRDTVLCGAANEVIRMEAPIGYSAYRWNGGASGGRYFDVSVPGIYSLEVQDEKGCTATTTFEVAPYCEDILIPNTFSPNGDGFNDTWMIGGLEDMAAVVSVFDRNGQVVFQSRGYGVPWDGLYKGRLVPVGAYYYHIAISGGSDYKGALNILY
ncbi:gliding motility-associated C-terminal domain-containing protein [Parapedobacter sp. 2B3]|uniref:T9SS type B sorting domain-containing protein n=1 Tax=Parapedobacter sp. 2B3 TaxID=3342381 RepID=UPI0035B62725